MWQGGGSLMIPEVLFNPSHSIILNAPALKTTGTNGNVLHKEHRKREASATNAIFRPSPLQNSWMRRMESSDRNSRTVIRLRKLGTKID